ncbi:MAG TPA: nucleotide exchange factor GrpE [Candidatus Saccharimonadales bacterium]|jgi:molecular chaperone GrpE|nr:nucleotide exchange factor GrpE [Candidatus Saccharimonadales bacterium]
MPKNNKNEELEHQIAELTADVQRVRADFENYRKRVEIEKEQAKNAGKAGTILKLLPVIDNIERAIAHLPEDLKENAWASSVVGLVKNLDKSLENLDLHRIEAAPGTPFNPELHEAIQVDESEGETEVIAEELQPGYKLANQVIRPSMVKVKRV